MKWHRLMILLVVLQFSGCGYGEVSPTTYEYAKALYSITNRQLSERLDAVSEQVAARHAAGEISGREAQWLEAIIDNARNERWQEAMESARQMMEDQVQG